MLRDEEYAHGPNHHGATINVSALWVVVCLLYSIAITTTLLVFDGSYLVPVFVIGGMLVSLTFTLIDAPRTR